jgi:hypothetical protein
MERITAWELYYFRFYNASLILEDYNFVPGDDVENCHAKYGAIDKLVYDLQSYVNAHISYSFDYLLMVCIL